MIYLFSEDGGLQIVVTETEAIAQCEGIDAHNSTTWFFDEDGNPLYPVFDRPVSEKRFLWFFGSVDIGEYHLEIGDNSHPKFVKSFSRSLSSTKYLEPNQFFTTLEQLTDHLRQRGVVAG